MSLCLVTGGGSGIGLATAQQLAQKHDVIICGRNTDKLNHALKIIQKDSTKKIYSYVADVSQETDVKALFERIRTIEQPLVACVNNAGALFKTPFLSMQASILKQTIAANLTSTFLCSQQACQLMKAEKIKGCIVNISSLAGIRGLQKFPGMSAYVAAKFAVCGLTEAMAAEVQDANIHINCVAPGAVDTEMLAQAKIQCDQTMRPEEVADVIVQFCDPHSLGRSTGTIFEMYQ